MALSRRSSRINCPPPEYVLAHVSALSNQYSAVCNPTGAIPMAIAENKLMSDSLINELNNFHSYTKECLGYTASIGLPSLRHALADFLCERIFMHESKTIDPNLVVVSAGCTGLLYQLSFTLFEEGDGILIPTPYYPAFDPDFMNIGGVKVIGVSCCNDDITSLDRLTGQLTLADLEAAYASGVAQGHPVKGLLLTNPNNPMGTIYTRESLLTAVSFCNQHKLHFICDEVYALSTFLFDDNNNINNTTAANPNTGDDFVSLVTLLDNRLSENIHILWSLSKDFGGSGLRCGVLYTQNHELRAALGRSNDAFQVSNICQQFIAHLLSRENKWYLDTYIQENRRLLAQSYTVLVNGLTPLGIKIVPALGGIFCFADFSCFMGGNSKEEEMKVFHRLVHGSHGSRDLHYGPGPDSNSNINSNSSGDIVALGGIILTPGSTCHCPYYGYFRICFAYVPIESVQEAVRRIGLLYPTIEPQIKT